jgi:hypothetical protein
MKTKDLVSAFFNVSNDLDLPSNVHIPPKGLKPIKTLKTVQPIKRNTNRKTQ